MILAGNAKLVTWVSSSSDDMDLHVSLRVYNENSEQLVYSTDQHRLDADQKSPLQQGRLGVSQRKLDVQRSTFPQHVSYVQLPIVSGLIEDQDAAWSVN